MFGRHRHEDEQLVASALRALADASPADRALPDPSFLWWKAQLLRRLEAERQATAPLDVGERFHVGAAVLGALALAGGACDQLASFSFTPTAMLSIVLGTVVLLSVVTLAAIQSRRER
ncbi:MAG TPA: hypothetical protein VM032_11685 [Vicinamibacterales bacterium]|nr:hypothetical protein [Vicinamibacterales bacterium]